MLTVLAALTLISACPELSPPPMTQAPPADGRSEQPGVKLSTPSSGGRVAGALMGTFMATGVTLVASLLVFAGLGGLYGPGDRGFHTALIVDAVGALVLLPLSAWLGHRMGGGEGSLGGAAAGGAVGTAVGAMLVGLGAVSLRGGSAALGVGAIFLGTLAAMIGPIVGVEISHNSNSALTPHVGIAPVKKGAAMSLAWVI